MTPASGSIFTVMAYVANDEHKPSVTVYVMMAVPAVTPVTTPVGLTDALVLPLLHTPPETLLVRVIVLATHTLVGPLMVPGGGVGSTVTTNVVYTEPQLLVTV
jgi:hypothetical protein